MARIDQVATEDFAIRVDMMMENAGRAVAAAVRRMTEGPGAVVVAAGPGNNGGGGLAAVRHLLTDGHDVSVIMADAARHAERTVLAYLGVVERLGVRVFGADALDDVESVDELAKRLGAATVNVDALLGYNARGELRGPVRRVADSLEATGRPVLALDLPSGLDADDGTVTDGTVRAAATVTLALPKTGLLRADKADVGRLWVATLGLAEPVFHAADVQGPFPAFEADGLVEIER